MFKLEPNHKDTPEFPLYAENDQMTQTFLTDNDIFRTATKGINCGDDPHPVPKLFFSKKNIQKIQKLIKLEIYKRSNGKYKLEEDQDISDILVAMRAIFYDANVGCRYLPFKIKEQVDQLNFQLVQYVVPDMFDLIKQYYGYMKEINEPLKPLPLPLNVSSAGRKTLPSFTTIYQV